MEDIIKLVQGGAAGIDKKKDDAFADRLSSRYTVIILCASALSISAFLFVGSPIQCWVPAHFTSGHEAYTNNYCWVKNTYKLKWHEQIPKVNVRQDHYEKRVIPYYQWIPFILIGQAILFYLPKALWNGLNQRVGVDADDIMTNAQTYTSGHDTKTLKLISTQVHRVLQAALSKRISFYDKAQCTVKKICTPCGPEQGNYLIILYLISKLLYIVNLLAQLFLLNTILSTQFNLYGFQALHHWIKGDDWTDSYDVAFPRVTFCDFNVRRLGNIHKYTVQCLLPINMYNEKIFMFLWFWFVFVLAASVIDFITWACRAAIPSDKVKFISNHLEFLQEDNSVTKKNEKVEMFTHDYLKQDGVFLLRLISHNTTNMTTTDITNALWDKWQEWTKNQPVVDDDDNDDDESASSGSGLLPTAPDNDDLPDKSAFV